MKTFRVTQMLRLMLPCALVSFAYPQNGALNATLIREIFGDNSRGISDRSEGIIQGEELSRVPVTPPIVQVNPGADADMDTSCNTDKGEVGECVQYFLCDSNNTIITNGVGIIDLRIRGPCESYLESCCVPSDRRQYHQPIVPSSGDGEKQQNTGCGWRNPDGVGFRIKGDYSNEAKFGEFPWMVALLKIEPFNTNDPEGQNQYLYLGGGSLIHQSVVLTAAHYVANATSLLARVGEWDTQTTNEIFPYQDRNVAEIEIHEEFNPTNLFYDIAVLFLETPVDIAPNVGLVCLPQPEERPPPNSRCFASGWGKDKFGKEGSYQVIMKKVDVPVVDHDTCQEQLRRTRLGRFFQLHSSFMCAGGEPGKDTCKGDGGSPLVCPIEYQPNRYRQYGIVAWGIKCGEGGTPGVYADVGALRAWLDRAVVGRGHDPAAYTA